MTPTYRLYSYFRSSCSYRVRIALALKGLNAEYVPVHLLQDGGQQYKEPYTSKNPMGEVPTLEVLGEGGQVLAALAQSVSILEYLEEAHPTPALLPSSPIERAKVRQLVEVVNSSIQPIQNLKVMRRLTEEFGVDMDRARDWGAYWVQRGFEGLERLISEVAGEVSFGDQVTLADVVLLPQHYNAVRFGLDMNQFPTISKVCTHLLSLEAFQKAAPDLQPDAPTTL